MESPRGGPGRKVGAGMLDHYSDTCNCGECDGLYYCRSCYEVHREDEAIVHSLMHTMNGDEQLTRAKN